MREHCKIIWELQSHAGPQCHLGSIEKRAPTPRAMSTSPRLKQLYRTHTTPNTFSRQNRSFTTILAADFLFSNYFRDFSNFYTFFYNFYFSFSDYS